MRGEVKLSGHEYRLKNKKHNIEIILNADSDTEEKTRKQN